MKRTLPPVVAVAIVVAVAFAYVHLAERKGYALSADFYFIDSKTGETLHKERFSEEVLYAEDQRISALSSYFELMDRLLPNFLGVITPQRIRGSRVLLR